MDYGALIQELVDLGKWRGIPMSILSTFGLTQFIKISSKIWFRKPCKPTVHFLSLVSAALSVYAIWDPPIGAELPRVYVLYVCAVGLTWIGAVAFKRFIWNYLESKFPRAAKVVECDVPSHKPKPKH